MSEKKEQSSKCIVSSVSMYEDDYALLEKLRSQFQESENKEWLSKSDILRRALRTLAATVGAP